MKEENAANEQHKAQEKETNRSIVQVREHMVTIVKDCISSYVGELGGDLYIRDAIPLDKQETAVKLLTKLLPGADPIEPDDIVALFLSYGGGQHKCFSTLLFTVKGFYYDVGGKRCNPGFVHWRTLWDIRRRFNRKTKIRKQITFCFHDGEREGSIFMPARYVHSVNHFLMPVLNQLSNAVEKEEEDKELGEILRSPTLRILGLHKASDLLKFKGEDDEFDNLIEMEDKKMSLAEKEKDQFLGTDVVDTGGEGQQGKDLPVYEAEVVDAEENDLREEDDMCDEGWEGKLERFLQQGDEAIELLDKAGRDFERSLDTLTDGLEKMMNSIEGMMEVALKR